MLLRQRQWSVELGLRKEPEDASTQHKGPSEKDSAEKKQKTKTQTRSRNMNGLTEGKFVIKSFWVLFKNLNFWVLQ